MLGCLSLRTANDPQRTVCGTRSGAGLTDAASRAAPREHREYRGDWSEGRSVAGRRRPAFAAVVGGVLAGAAVVGVCVGPPDPGGWPSFRRGGDRSRAVTRRCSRLPCPRGWRRQDSPPPSRTLRRRRRRRRLARPTAVSSLSASRLPYGSSNSDQRCRSTAGNLQGLLCRRTTERFSQIFLNRCNYVWRGGQRNLS